MDYYELRKALEAMYRNGSYQTLISYFTTKKEECLKSTMERAGDLTKEDFIKANERMVVFRELENIIKDVEEEIKLSESKSRKVERVAFAGKAA